jgi:hypothetical protein
MWNKHGIYVDSRWIPCGMSMESIGKYLIYMMKHIPYGIHMDSMEYIHSMWIPYGMWGQGKVLDCSGNKTV